MGQCLGTEQRLKNNNSLPDDPMQFTWLQVTAYSCLSFYVLLLAMTVHNIFKYLVAQERYKTFLVFIFYLLALATVVVRTLFYINSAIFYKFMQTTYVEHGYSYSTIFLDPATRIHTFELLQLVGVYSNMAVYFKIILGYF